jgi:hypothetical protein
MTTTDITPREGPLAIFIIRHGEKPPDASKQSDSAGPPYGVDIDGKTDPDSLIPQGWQRAGALATLFDATGSLQESSGVISPTVIATPDYGTPQKHRTFETVLPTAQKLDLTPHTKFPVGKETHLVDWALAQVGEVVLICWEHDHIIKITGALQNVRTVTGAVPGPWPSDRFDIVVALWPDTTNESGGYLCSQVPQLLLAGDSSDPIPSASS